ncbi:hypothetical protein D9V32_15175 [Mycetocola tolaasinivorans]|uniref:Uncharacterized protein n=1 Tax=Mycetocola tolaasinivorans TaxID=76635 RepID=A0A3L6ZXM3_9MICO|nr:hypothetical protein [Mycetocola tolaasinivorans]RLP72783.1 hypothetical protein D9V32_15175 [Mycetocola tolaasinivorans]
MDAFDVKGWPRTLTWEKDFALYADGPRTPRQVADDLTPWLLEQGWKPRKIERPPADENYLKYVFFKDEDTLIISYIVTPPPYAQNMILKITLPRVK